MTPEEISLYGDPLFRKSKTTATHRHCNKCHAWKEYSEYHKDKNRDPQITHMCKGCESVRREKKRRKRYAKIEAKYGRVIPASNGVSTETHKRCSKCGQWKKHRHFGINNASVLGLTFACKRCNHDTDLQSRYGISIDDYLCLLEKQDGGCAICGDAAAHSNTEKLFVDHDHKTGKVRGLLCHRCNSMLGYSKDSVANLRLGIQYLERGSK